MDLVTMVLACGLYPDNSITNAMLQTGTQNNALVVTVDGTAKTFKTADQAAQYASEQIQAGHSVDVGLMQIPSHWLNQYNADLHDMFLPCQNMVMATKVLNDAESQCEQAQTNPPVTNTQTCALSVYKTGNAKTGMAYANTVMAYANSHPFSNIQAEAETKNPAGFHMIPGDAPTTATTKNASSINPSTDKVKKIVKVKVDDNNIDQDIDQGADNSH